MSDDDNIRRLRRPESDGSAPGRRWKTNWPAELSSSQGSTRCVVLDISSWGAQLRLEAPAPAAEQVWLAIDNIGTIAAEIVWRNETMLGVQFLEQQAWIRRLYAQRLDPATWSPLAGMQHRS